MLTAGDERTDLHSFAQAILKKQFPELSGLYSTLLIPHIDPCRCQPPLDTLVVLPLKDTMIVGIRETL